MQAQFHASDSKLIILQRYQLEFCVLRDKNGDIWSLISLESRPNGKRFATQRIGQLLNKGVKQLELRFRAIAYQPAEPLLIADDDRNCPDVSCGAAKLLGLPRDKIIARRIDDLAEPTFRTQVERLWRTFLEQGKQRGTFRLAGSDGSVREVEYTANVSGLPVRPVLALRDKSKQLSGPAWVQDYAVLLFDSDERVAAWYSGAERIYGYTAKEIAGRLISCLYPSEDTFGVKLQEELKKAVAQGHFGNEG